MWTSLVVGLVLAICGGASAGRINAELDAKLAILEKRVRKHMVSSNEVASKGDKKSTYTSKADEAIAAAKEALLQAKKDKIAELEGEVVMRKMSYNKLSAKVHKTEFNPDKGMFDLGEPEESKPVQEAPAAVPEEPAKPEAEATPEEPAKPAEAEVLAAPEAEAAPEEPAKPEAEATPEEPAKPAEAEANAENPPAANDEATKTAPKDNNRNKGLLRLKTNRDKQKYETSKRASSADESISNARKILINAKKDKIAELQEEIDTKK
jgi:hypothetical protein